MQIIALIWKPSPPNTFLVISNLYPVRPETSKAIETPVYRRDVPKAQVHVLEAGHFALDTAADEIADLVRRFMSNKQ